MTGNETLILYLIFLTICFVITMVIIFVKARKEFKKNKEQIRYGEQINFKCEAIKKRINKVSSYDELVLEKDRVMDLYKENENHQFNSTGRYYIVWLFLDFMENEYFRKQNP